MYCFYKKPKRNLRKTRTRFGLALFIQLLCKNALCHSYLRYITILPHFIQHLKRQFKRFFRIPATPFIKRI